jgi:hypothetical protein
MRCWPLCVYFHLSQECSSGMNYSLTGTAYKGGSEVKIDKGGSPVVQGQKDRSPRMMRGTGETKREGPGEVSDTRDSGTTRRSVT